MVFDIHTHKVTDRLNELVNATFDKLPNGWFSIGIHPWTCQQEVDLLPQINELCQKNNCLAIGEIGLDRLKGPAMEIQMDCFQKQIEISEKYKLPVILHCVRAWDLVKSIHKKCKPTQQWVLHGFNQAKILNEVLERELLVSIGPSIFSNKSLQESIQHLPIESLLLETDDTTADISQLYQFISELKNIPLESLEKQIERTIKRTFPKWKIG